MLKSIYLQYLQNRKCTICPGGDGQKQYTTYIKNRKSNTKYEEEKTI